MKIAVVFEKYLRELLLAGIYTLGILGIVASGGSGSGSDSDDVADDTPMPPEFYFKASNSGDGDFFARAVTLSGDGSTLAIGAWLEASDGSSEANDGASAAGAVYVFRRSVSASGEVSWSQVAYVKALAPVSGENFGYSVSLTEDGSRLAVGAPDIGGATPGKVYVFIGPNYDTAPDEITDPSAVNGDRFGEAVALSEDGFRLAIGAPGDDVAAADAGAVYVYEDLGNLNTWTLEDSFTPSPAGAAMGVSVALNQDGSVLAAGAWREDGMVAEEGAVYTFTRDATPVWTPVTKLEASDGALNDRFGVSVSLSDDGVRLAVGAPGDFIGAGGFTGAAYVYTGNAVPLTGWIDEVKVNASNAEADDAFGIAVALDDNGDKLLVGASREDGSGTGFGSTVDDLASGAGAAYLFERTAPPAWTEIEYIKATNTDAGDQFGTSVSMDDSGNRLVVGAQAEESLVTGVNGDQTDNSGSNVGATYLWNLE